MWVKAETLAVRKTRWINFTFSLLLSYYQLTTLLESSQTTLNSIGLTTITLISTYTILILG
jgi:hypothetical protein